MYLTRLASLYRLGTDTSLLVNALSGAVDLVNDEVRTKLLGIRLGRRPALDEQYRESLVARGYLFPDQGGERAALNDLYGAYQQFASSRPIEFVVCPTYSCNLTCTYCFESAELRARPEVMNGQQTEHLFAAMERMAAARPGKACQIVLFGGEPLLPITEQVVGEILARAAVAGYKVYLTTNGTHLARFASLLRRHPETVKGAQITLDGPQPIHDARRKSVNGRGSFADVVGGVEVCLEAGIAVNLRVNLDAHNIGSLEDLVDAFERRGWAGREGFRCQLAPVTDHVGTSTYSFMMREDELVEPVLALWRRRPDLRKTLDFQLFRVLQHVLSVIEDEGRLGALPRFHYCESDRGDVFTFGPDGLIYVCPESAGDPQYAVGVYSPRYELSPRWLQQWENRNVLTLPECQQCNIATFCGGGCGYAALRQFGSLAHGVCADAPKIVEAYMNTLRKRFQNGDFEPLSRHHPPESVAKTRSD